MQIFSLRKRDFLSLKKAKTKICSCLTVLFFSLFGNSCLPLSENDKFEKYLAEKSVSRKNFDYAVIIPRAGCSGCISKAENFFLDYQKQSAKSKRTAFIFTKFESKKLLRLKFGKDLTERQNVFFDKENEISKLLTYDDQYPVLIKFQSLGIEIIQESDKTSFIKQLRFASNL
jgi:hypothetical protein